MHTVRNVLWLEFLGPGGNLEWYCPIIRSSPEKASRLMYKGYIWQDMETKTLGLVFLVNVGNSRGSEILFVQ